MRNIINIGWFAAVTSMIAIVAGHQGVHALSWKANQISTYAAIAPYDYLVTAAMLLSSLLLLVIGILVSRYKIVGTTRIVDCISPLSGAAMAGLIMLSYYEETAKSLEMLKQSGFWAVREQSFHDAGLQIFFYSSLLLILLLGFLVIVNRENSSHKAMGVTILLLSPASYLLMTTSWPKAVGFIGLTVGINQRAGLLCLWIGAVIFLTIASNAAPQPPQKSATEL